jgi:hypothetical protein
VLILAIICIFTVSISYYKNLKEDTLEFNDLNLDVKKLDFIVVLYNLQYRTWDKTAHNHLNVIEKVSNDCIIGSHYWNDNIHTDIPIELRKFKYKTSQSENIPDLPNTVHLSGIEYITTWFKRHQISTKIALKNAEEVYGSEMSDDQIILVIRPDVIITDISSFPEVPHLEDNFFMSIWNTKWRPSFTDESKIEMNNAIYIARKKTINLICNLNIDDIPNEFKLYSAEHMWYKMLNYLNINIIYNFDIHFAIQKDQIIQMS